MIQKLVAGVDFGSDSVRAVVLDARTGTELAHAACPYVRWQDQCYCDPVRSQFRQHPLDYLEGLTQCMQTVMDQIGPAAQSRLLALAIDTTGSTPCPVDRQGTPLALLAEFADNPNAMFHLWKDHTAVTEAREIDQVFTAAKMDYTQFQGVYSSEWYWAKILHTTCVDDGIRAAAWSWVEHCDWLPALLIGQTDPVTMYRGACAAGHKALWHSHFGGLPDPACLASLDPCLAALALRYQSIPQPAGSRLGVISPAWAERLGVPATTLIGGGSFDAHAGAVGAGIRPRTLVKVVGTSTVDMLIAEAWQTAGKDLRAYCGQTEHSIVPGYIGIEAGQAAFGDLFAWFASLLMWPLREILPRSPLIRDGLLQQLTTETASQMIASLEAHAARMAPVASGLTAVDWFNGRRYPHLNEQVQGALFGLNLGSTAPALYRALVQSAVFGSRRIFDSLIDQGLAIDQLIVVGGIAEKSPYTMQLLADILKRPVMVSRQANVCARGAAIYAAVAAGLYPDVPAAQVVLCEPCHTDFYPNRQLEAAYEQAYQRYLIGGTLVETLVP